MLVFSESVGAFSLILHKPGSSFKKKIIPLSASFPVLSKLCWLLVQHSCWLFRKFLLHVQNITITTTTKSLEKSVLRSKFCNFMAYSNFGWKNPSPFWGRMSFSGKSEVMSLKSARQFNVHISEVNKFIPVFKITHVRACSYCDHCLLSSCILVRALHWICHSKRDDFGLG